jgi:CheY-like chemotaxis protein
MPAAAEDGPSLRGGGGRRADQAHSATGSPDGWLGAARGQERDKVRALDLGADDYLTKPFAVDEVIEAAKDTLAAKPNAEE